MEPILPSTVPSAATLGEVLSTFDRIETESENGLLVKKNFPVENRINWKHFSESLKSVLQLPEGEKFQVKIFSTKTQIKEKMKTVYKLYLN